MCKFCESFDFGSTGYTNILGGYKVYFATHAGGVPEEERFKFCPVCGRDLSATSDEEMKRPTKEELEQLSRQYIPGLRVRLVRMDDPQAPPVGTLGTCYGVDAAGNIMVDWDNGSGLNVAYGVDVCVPVRN